jgi:hypothetical protein
MLDHTGARAHFDRVEVSEARKSLGIMIAVNGKMKLPDYYKPLEIGKLISLPVIFPSLTRLLNTL